MAPIKHIFKSGILSGFILGCFLMLIEFMTGKKVYTLLLNVDFIPLFNRVIWPEWMEFLFHLIISLAAAAAFFIFLQSGIKPYPAALAVALPAAFLYFPLSVLSAKPVAAADDSGAFFYWTAGHLLYALSLGFYGQKYKRKA